MFLSSISFLFYYLPIVLFLYYLTPRRFQNVVLLLFNLLFYGWNAPLYSSILLISSMIAYTHGYLVDHFRSRKILARYFVFQSVILHLFLLFFFKYYPLFSLRLPVSSPYLHNLLLPLEHSLPLGISFYTLQTMSYTIDIYRKSAPVERNFINVGVFSTLFPLLILGPIVPYKHLAPQLHSRNASISDVSAGITQFTVGLCKKILLSNNMNRLWIQYNHPTNLGIMQSWLGITAFAFHLYFELSGYADMACGLGKMLGFRFPINFQYPFAAHTLSELLRRWHITLIHWFYKYVYTPLGGEKKGTAIKLRNIVIVWLLVGLWHRFTWNFVIWGLFLAITFLCEKYIWGQALLKCPRFFQHVYTKGLFLLSLSFFAIEGGLQSCISYLRSMLGMHGLFGLASDTAFLFAFRSYAPLLVLCAVGATPYVKRTYLHLSNRVRCICTPLLVLIGLILCTAYLMSGFDEPFLYFRF